MRGGIACEPEAAIYDRQTDTVTEIALHPDKWWKRTDVSQMSALDMTALPENRAYGQYDAMLEAVSYAYVDLDYVSDEAAREKILEARDAIIRSQSRTAEKDAPAVQAAPAPAALRGRGRKRAYRRKASARDFPRGERTIVDCN